MPPTKPLASRISQQSTVEAVEQLLILRKSTNTGPYLWPHSGAFFRRQFKYLCCHFVLDAHQFRPYSLKRGGATYIFQCSGSMELAMLKGRWKSSRTARDGLSYLPNTKMSPHTDKLLRQYHFFSYHQG